MASRACRAEKIASRTRSLVGRVPNPGTAIVIEPANPAMMRVTLSTIPGMPGSGRATSRPRFLLPRAGPDHPLNPRRRVAHRHRHRHRHRPRAQRQNWNSAYPEPTRMGGTPSSDMMPWMMVKNARLIWGIQSNAKMPMMANGAI